MTKDIILVFVAADSADATEKCELIKHLRQIENVRVEHQPEPGTDVAQWIKELSYKSDIVIPILSPDFLVNTELFQAVITVNIDRHRDGAALLLPVLLRHCLWDGFFRGTTIRILPNDKIPVLSRRRADRIWKEIATVVSGAAELLLLRNELVTTKFELNQYKSKLNAKQSPNSDY